MTFEALGSQRSTDGRRRIQYKSGRTASCVAPAAAKDKRKHLADPLFRRLSRFTEDLLHPGDVTQRAFCCWLSALHCIWTGSSLFPRSCRKIFFGGVRRCFLSQHFCSSKLLLYKKVNGPADTHHHLCDSLMPSGPVCVGKSADSVVFTWVRPCGWYCLQVGWSCCVTTENAARTKAFAAPGRCKGTHQAVWMGSFLLYAFPEKSPRLCLDGKKAKSLPKKCGFL